MRLGELLVSEKLVTPEGLEEALESQVVHGGRLGTNLVELGLLSEKDLARLLGKQHNVAFAAGEMVPDPKALELVEPGFADDRDLLPMRLDQTRLTVAVINPHDLEAFDALGFKSGKRVVPVVIPEFRMNQLLRKHFKAFRNLRPIDVNSLRPSRTLAGKEEKTAEPAGDLMSEDEFQSLYAQAMGGADEEEVLEGTVIPEEERQPAAARPSEAPLATAPSGAPPVLTYPPSGAPPVLAGAPPSGAPVLSSPSSGAPPVFGATGSVIPAALAAASSSAPPLLGATASAIPAALAAPSSGAPPLAGATASGAPPVFTSSPSGAPPVLGATASGAPPVLGATASGAPPVFGATASGAPPVFAAAPSGTPSALTPAAPGQPPPLERRAVARAVSEPVISPLTFPEAQQLLQASADREDVAKTVLRFALSKWKRSLLLSVQGDLVTGWHGAGQGIREKAVRRIGIALRGQSTFKLVRDTRSHFIGPMKRDAGTAVFYKMLGGGFPKTAVLLPLLVRGKVVHVLYVDNGPDVHTPPDIGELLILSQSVARSYEAMMRRRKGG